MKQFKNKTFHQVLAVVLTIAALMTGQTAWADEFTDGNLVYTTSTDNKVYVKQYSGDMPEGTSFTIPDKVTYNTVDYTVVGIESGAFRNKTNLVAVDIPASLTYIGQNAFDGCTNLATVSGCEGVTNIERQAFASCTSLTTFTIPAGVTNLFEYTNDCIYFAFYDCRGLTAFTVAEGNTTYKSIDGILFNYAGTKLINYPRSKASNTYTIPDGVTTIEMGAFYRNPNITTLIVPGSVNSIGDKSLSLSTNGARIIFLGAAPPSRDGTPFYQFNGGRYVPYANKTDYAIRWSGDTNLISYYTVTTSDDATVTPSATPLITIGNTVYCVANSTFTLGHNDRTGYTFDSYIVKDDDNNDVTVNEGTFTVTEKNVTVSATWNLKDLSHPTSWGELSLALASASTDANAPTTLTLAADITAGASDKYLKIQQSRHVILDLNGHTLSRGLSTPTNDGHVITVQSGSLTICDGSATQIGTITGGYDLGNYGCIAVGSNATLTIEGGTIRGNRISLQGGSAIYANGGTIRMTGGTITDNWANIGREGYPASNLNSCGAIYFGGATDFYMSGGSITGNRCGTTTAGSAGLGVNLSIGSVTVHLSGSYYISGNQQGTYSNGTWSDLTPSDILNCGRLGIQIDAAINPTNPARLILNSSTSSWKTTFTAGWSTNMDTAEPEDYFTLADNTLGIGIVDGEATIGTKHNITLTDGITANVASAAPGKRITLAPEAGLHLVFSTYYDDNEHDAIDNGDGTWSFQMPAADVTVSAIFNVPYIDKNGDSKTCTNPTFITNATQGPPDGWYVVSGNVSLSSISFIDSPNIILCDGAKLTVKDKNNVRGDITTSGLTIYAQSAGTGAIEAGTIKSNNANFTIYGGNIDINSLEANYIEIDGGNMTATTANNQTKAAIYSQTLTRIYGGQVTVTATGCNGIECGEQGVNIYGGRVTATATGTDCYGISAQHGITLGWTNATDFIQASSYSGNSIYINGGQVFTDGNGHNFYGNFTDMSTITNKKLVPSGFRIKANGHDGNYWTTFYYGTANFSAPEGVTIYKAAKNSTSVTLTKVEGGIIPAGQGVILKATASNVTNDGYLTLPVTTTPATGDYTGNELKGVDKQTAQEDDYTYYVLSKKDNNFGFYKLAKRNSNNSYIVLGAHKAYFEVPTDVGAPVRDFYGFDFEDEVPTAIDHSTLTIDHYADGWYTMDGRKLNGMPTTKGVFINNGRKVVIK